MMEKRTSQEWYDLLPETEKPIILDADGWDRKNFNYSWNIEKITEEEFNKRLMFCTVQMPKVNRYIKIECGNSYIDTLKGAKEFLEEMVKGGELDEEYNLSVVEMTEKSFNELPEFTGF